MENIIKQVIESEYKAQQIIDEALEERKHSARTIEDEVQKIKEDIFASAKKQSEIIKADKKKYADMQADDIASKANLKVSLMRKKLEENRSIWVKVLLDNVLNINE